MAKARGVKKSAAIKPRTDAQPEAFQTKRASASAKHKTPFTYRITDSEHCALLGSDGKALAVFLASEEQMKFICRACNNFSALKQIARLSRGEVECEDDERYLYKSAAHKAMRELFARVDREVLHG